MYMATKNGQFALLMGMAGALRRITSLEDKLAALADYVGDRAVRTSIDGIDAEPGPGVSDRESLLMLAVDFEVAATKLKLRSRAGEVQPLRRRAARPARGVDVSRETLDEDAPDTERGSP